MIGLGVMKDLHQYVWMNYIEKQKVDLKNAYCIVPSDEKYNVSEKYSGYYSQIDSITTIEIIRNKIPAHSFSIYRLSGFKGELPMTE